MTPISPEELEFEIGAESDAQAVEIAKALLRTLYACWKKRRHENPR
jgi:hypothetical protein